MSLHNGLDTVAIATIGTYTETYGSAAQANVNNLFASWGFLEDAPFIVEVVRGIRNLIRLGLSLRL